MLLQSFLSVIRKILLMETKNTMISIIPINMARVRSLGGFILCKALSTGHDKTNGRFQLLTKILFSILPATFPTNPFTCMSSAPLRHMSCHCTFPRANLFSPSISMPPVDLVAASAAVHDNNASPPPCRHLGPLAYILHELWASALCPQHCFHSCFLHWGNPETPYPCTSSPPSQ